MSDNLPPEILTEIFLHLTIETLGQLTTVCKSWHALISTPAFISLLSTRHNSSSSSSLILTWSAPYVDPDSVNDRLTLHFDNGVEVSELRELQCEQFGNLRRMDLVRFVGCCHGVICLFVNDFRESMVLWNPRIQKSVTVPQPPRSCVYGGRVFLGFGFDSVECDYKVVRLVYRNRNIHIDDAKSSDAHLTSSQLEPEVEVYSLNSGVWRSRVENGGGGGDEESGSRGAGSKVYSHYLRSQTFVNGALHWLVLDRVTNNYTWILKFDMNSEECGTMQLPDEDVVAAGDAELITVFGNRLGLSVYCVSESMTTFLCDFWVMEAYGVEASWTKLYRFVWNDPLAYDPQQTNVRPIPMGYRRNGDLLQVTAATGDLRLGSLDTETGKFTQHGIPGVPICVDPNYKETLALINRPNSTTRHALLHFLSS